MASLVMAKQHLEQMTWGKGQGRQCGYYPEDTVFLFSILTPYAAASPALLNGHGLLTDNFECTAEE